MATAAPQQPQPPGRLRRLMRTWSSLSWSDRALLIEALLMVSCGRLAIRTLPFATIGRFASRSRTDTTLSPEETRTLVRRVRWAVLACARRVPFRALCFEQGLAAHTMLRRRTIPSVLYYGAAQESGPGLIAHVWVKVGEVYVTGGEVAHRFALLVQFPQDSAEGRDRREDS